MRCALELELDSLQLLGLKATLRLKREIEELQTSSAYGRFGCGGLSDRSREEYHRLGLLAAYGSLPARLLSAWDALLGIEDDGQCTVRARRMDELRPARIHRLFVKAP